MPRAFCDDVAEAQNRYLLQAPSTKFEAKLQGLNTKPRPETVTVRQLFQSLPSAAADLSEETSAELVTVLPGQ